jgi:DNA-binding MarR family transcriptional regulator
MSPENFSDIVSSVKDIVAAEAPEASAGGTEREPEGRGLAWTEERRRSDEGRQGLKSAPEASAGGTAAELMGAISAIRRIARRAVRAAWHDEPLPPAQSELLRLAAALPGISVADAAHELRLAPNTVSTLVGRLTAAGLLSRGRAASDGRSVRLTVTDKARQRIAGWRDLRAEVAARALDRLTAQDREALAGAVPALIRLAAELELEAP